MDVQFELPEMIGLFGLYKYYIIKDTTSFYNKRARRYVEDFLKE
jgi:hypothetical protein